jgi:hypothetical protein
MVPPPTDEGQAAGDDEEGLVVLVMNVLWRSAGTRRQRALYQAEAVPGVAAILEDPEPDGTVREPLAASPVDNADRHASTLEPARPLHTAE